MRLNIARRILTQLFFDVGRTNSPIEVSGSLNLYRWASLHFYFVINNGYPGGFFFTFASFTSNVYSWMYTGDISIDESIVLLRLEEFESHPA